MRKIYSLLTLFLTVTGPVGHSQNTDHLPGTYKFLENKGQWPDHVKFRASVQGGHIWLENYGILYQFNNYGDYHHAGLTHKETTDIEILQDLVFARFIGANERIETSQDESTTEYYNFFIGNDKSKWATGVFGYCEVEYKELYEGIDLIFYEKEGDLKYEYRVKPYANPSLIKIQYHGQDRIRKTRDGDIIIETKLGQIIEQKPYVYQIKNGKIVQVDAEFILSDTGILSFKLGTYDQDLELVIDPVLVFATYSGSPTDNFGMTGTYAYNGDGYSGGTIYGNAYPVPFSGAYNINATLPWIENPNPFPISYGITDVFISKYSSDGTQMLWTNFLGGGDQSNGTETVHSLICDTSNNVYLYGATSSTDFPMQNAYQGTHSGGVPGGNFVQNGVFYTNQGTDIWVAKLSADGTSLLGSTYIGGSGNDGINYNVTSYANQYNDIVWYDSLTSNYGDQFRGEIMLDSMNNVIIASCSRSTDFPTVNAFQPSNAGQQDGVVFKLSSDFSSLIWSSYLGGSENDACYSVKIDSSFNIIVGGGTSSNDLSNTTGGLYSGYQGGATDGFVSKITPDGLSLVQTTYFGSNLYDQVYFVEIDRWDNIYIYGQTNGPIPIINASYFNANSGQFITKLTPDLTTIDYSTRIGNGDGNPDISPSAFLVDVCGNVYISGWGANILQSVGLNGMPTTTDALQPTTGDGFNFYLFVLERDAASMLYGSYLGGGLSHEHVDGGTSRFDKYGIIYQSVCGGCWGNSDFPTSTGAWSSQNLDNNGCNNLLFKFDFEIVPVAEFTTNQYEGCAPMTIVLDNESNDTVNFSWSFPPDVIIVSGGVNPEVTFPDTGTYIITLTIFDTICNLMDTAQKVITVYETNSLNVTDDILFCNGDNFDLIANSSGTATSFIWSSNINFTDTLNSGPMDSTINVSPIIPTTYYVTTSNGWPSCDLIDSVQVIPIEDGIDVVPDTTICWGLPAILYAENLFPEVNITWDWAPDSAITSENGDTTMIQPPSSMWYYVTATTDLGCVLNDSVFVTVAGIDPSTIYAVADPDTVDYGQSTTLSVFPNNSGFAYVWEPVSSTTPPVGQSVSAIILQDSYFEVTIDDGYCQYKTGVNVYLHEYFCGEEYIYIPNAFSPNGDGANDHVFVRGQNLTQLDFKIFDRWGELVFETTDQTIGWDGTYKGAAVDPDVYVYHLKATCIDGTEYLIKGNITLLR